MNRSAVVDAFDAAVDYWHQQLDEPIADHAADADHPDRPDTARDYFESVRGYDSDTVDAWRLGWAPGDGGLYDHLREQGFGSETIAATGLFCEKAPTKELWRGRYIFPYFAADGAAEYAIARCTGSKGGGAADYDGHSADFLAGKYAKVAHTREYVPLDEPILGLHTLPDADEVIIAEGIADAISATEAGYAVLSPVTKEFKREHFDAVVDAVEEHDIDRVYVAPDAEPVRFSRIDSDDVPDEPDHIYDAITQPAVAPGPGGGLRTANYLVEQDIDARVVELPRPSGGKMDLDDYIQEWKQGLDAVLRSAKRPADHPKFDAATATQNTDENVTEGASDAAVVENTNVTENVTAVTTNESASALFELGVDDVNPSLSAGDRGKNPLGHTGNSENYFAVYEIGGETFAKDYKRPGEPVYNGLTYLLVDADERPVEGPEGALSPWETWVAWREARKRGLLTADDPVPTAALEGIAREEGLYDFDAFDDVTSDADDAPLPAKAYNRALYHVNNVWAEDADVDLDGDENATAKDPVSKTATEARTWEDVRYIYEGSKQEGRDAARRLLSSRYHLLTVEGTDTLRVYDEETGIYTEETGPIRAEIYDGLGTHWTTHELNEILSGLMQHDIVPQHELNGRGLDGPHICVGNGVLDPLARELLEHDPAYCFVDRVPVDYAPDVDTEPYEEFVSSLVEREADTKALFEMVGHALMPDANERYKKFLMLTGDADNGKSAFYGRVKSLLDGPTGEERNTSSVKLEKMAQNRFSIASMYGAFANIAGEIDGKKIRNTASIKDITGGDPVEIEPKGKESYFDTINTTLMFAANDPPIIGERDKEAIATRIVPVELPYTFVDDPDGPYQKQKTDERELEARLDDPDALSGLLLLALDGIQRLEENGDVSLPEGPEERLRMYEREADPMREFGERCLTNDPDDYVAKADVTTIYKEFAVSEGYEVGSNIGSVLHDVLRGVPEFNYTESRKRRPDYSDTSLPLRPWEERKFVVDRATLTEEGIEYAKSAGLVPKTTEKGESDGSNPGLKAIEPGRHTVEVTIAEKRDPKPWQQGRGTVVDDGELMDYVAEGSSNPLAAAEEGDRVRIENAKVGTDRDGIRRMEISRVCDVEVLGSVDDEQTSVATATDGGPGDDDGDTDADAPGQATAAVAELVANADEPLSFSQIIQQVEIMDVAKAKKAFEKAKADGKITEVGDDEYTT